SYLDGRQRGPDGAQAETWAGLGAARRGFAAAPDAALAALARARGGRDGAARGRAARGVRLAADGLRESARAGSRPRGGGGAAGGSERRAGGVAPRRRRRARGQEAVRAPGA